MRNRPTRLEDRAHETAERLAGEAFDRLDVNVGAWIDDSLVGNTTDRAQDCIRNLTRAAIAFSQDGAHLTALKLDVEALRDEYVDTEADRVYGDEAFQIEREEDEAAAEAYADTLREERLIEAHEAATRG